MKRFCVVVPTAMAILAVVIPLNAGNDRDKAPEFPKNLTWLQSEPLRLKELQGNVVILHFFTYGCINCQHNYPIYRNWRQQFDANKVKIIGVHTPEFDGEKEVQRVHAKIKENDLQFPIVIDNAAAVWKAWRTRCWPTIFLIDKRGLVRYHWEGELHLNNAEAKRFAGRIDELLAEKD